MDIIFIDELRLPTLIGIYPREQVVPQTIEMSLQIGTSTRTPAAATTSGDTIDYAVVVERLRADLGAPAFQPAGKTGRARRQPAARRLRRAIWVRVTIAKLGVMRGVRASASSSSAAERG
jgi:dihydroneopterin aldolase